MDELVATSGFKIYAAVVALLALKSVGLAFATVGARTVRKRYPNPEDAALFKAEQGEDELTARIKRAHANAAENEPLFMILGLLYLVMDAPTWGIQAYAYTYVIARYLHSVCYVFKLQPFRSGLWVVSALCLIGMCVQVLMSAFGV